MEYYIQFALKNILLKYIISIISTFFPLFLGPLAVSLYWSTILLLLLASLNSSHLTWSVDRVTLVSNP